MVGISMIDYNRLKKYDCSQGGNNKVYVMPFVDYLDSQITVVNNILINFPLTEIYSIDAVNINYSIDANDNFYDEKLSFQLKKISDEDSFKRFISRDYRVILRDNNNKIRMFGLKTGMIGSYKEESGTNRNEFNGYSFNFQTKEENSAPFLNDLTNFEVSGMLQYLLQKEL